MPKVVSIHDGSGITTQNINPDVILENLKGEMSVIIIAGYDKQGKEVFSSSCADGGEALWLIERFKKALLEVGDDLE